MTLSFWSWVYSPSCHFFGSMLLEQSESVTISNQDQNVKLQTRGVKLPRSSWDPHQGLEKDCLWLKFSVLHAHVLVDGPSRALRVSWLHQFGPLSWPWHQDQNAKILTKRGKLLRSSWDPHQGLKRDCLWLQVLNTTCVQASKTLRVSELYQLGEFILLVWIT